jgi:chromosome partitioning protein
LFCCRFSPKYDIETLGSVQEILTLAGNPPAAVLVNRAPIQGQRHTETQEAATAAGFDNCPVVLFQRAAHGDAGNIGRTASEYDPDGKAAQEMNELYAYITTALYEKERHEKKHAQRGA